MLRNLLRARYERIKNTATETTTTTQPSSHLDYNDDDIGLSPSNYPGPAAAAPDQKEKDSMAFQQCVQRKLEESRHGILYCDIFQT